MKIGYIHNNKDEQAKVMGVLRMISIPGAVDELGIGRIRDFFADRMFPGISTLQQRLKYFSLMPQLYKRVAESSKVYESTSEVKADIIKLERKMTEVLCKCDPDENGITGREMYNKPSFVKYDPVYIYNSGLQTFGILQKTDLYTAILKYSNALYNAPKQHKSNDEAVADDAAEKLGLFQFCNFPTGIDYDFTKECHMALTPADKEFIRWHILSSPACKGSLLHYIVDNEAYVIPNDFASLTNLPASLARIQDCACRFANFIYMVHVRYNLIYSGYADKEVEQRFKDLLSEYRQQLRDRNCKSIDDINDVFDEVSLSAVNSKYYNACLDFCRNVATCFDEGGNMQRLDKLIVDREKEVKKSRCKIGKAKYDSRNKVHYHKLDYRWNTVKRFIEELR